MTDEVEAVGEQGLHSFLDGGFLELVAWGAFVDQDLESFVDSHDFVDPAASFVADTAAFLAEIPLTPCALDFWGRERVGFVEGELGVAGGSESEASEFFRAGVVGDAAFIANSADETLGNHTDQCARYHEGFNAHFIQSCDRSGCIVGVKGGQD